MKSSEQAVIDGVSQWLREIVIGLNFCPFAKREFERQSIRYQVSRATSQDHALTALQQALSELDQDATIETTLVIFADGFSELADYLDLLDLANLLIEHSGYAGIYQIASFHPDYLFEGEAPDDASHFTNRAPLPILHVLREASLDRALRTYKAPETIPQVNIETAQKLGNAWFAEQLARYRSAFSSTSVDQSQSDNPTAE